MISSTISKTPTTAIRHSAHLNDLFSWFTINNSQPPTVTNKLKSMKLATLWLFSFLLAISAFAHDTWLIPDRFQIAPGETVTLDLTSGMEFPKLDVGPKRERIQAVICRLAGRTFELKDFEAGPTSLRIKSVLSDPGVAALWVKSPPKEIELKPNQVQEYLDEIDAPAAVRQQWTGTKEPKRWRESYRKHSKTFVRVGDAKADTSWREPVGMFLEIVPEKDPTRFDWRRLSGARFKDAHRRDFLLELRGG